MTWPMAFAIFGVCVFAAVACGGMFWWFIREDEITADIVKSSGGRGWESPQKDVFRGDTK